MRLEEALRERRFEVILALCGLILVGTGVFWWRGGGKTETQIEILPEAAQSQNQSGEGTVVVDVAGAVSSPGVYRLGSGARVEEAIASAGGGTAEGGEEWMGRNINLSVKLVDGMKIYIPARNQNTGEASTSRANSQNSNQTPEEKTQNNGALQVKIDINSASQTQLEELPGVGPVTAGKIIAGRPYMRIEELIEKKIVNQRVWEQIQDKISLW